VALQNAFQQGARRVVLLECTLVELELALTGSCRGSVFLLYLFEDIFLFLLLHLGQLI
jgi:hypothetical protein